MPHLPTVSHSPYVEHHVEVVLAVLLATTAVGCATLAVRRVSPWWSGLVAAALLGTGAWWARSNKTVEGGILVTLTPRHGIVVADLLSVQAGLVALAVATRGVGAWRSGRLR